MSEKAPHEIKLMAPDGARIVASFDTINGVAALLNSVTRTGKTVAINYSGTTDSETVWNNQRPVIYRGQIVLDDSNGRQWSANQLISEGSTPSPAESLTLLPYNDVLALVHRIYDLIKDDPSKTAQDVLAKITDSKLSVREI